MALISAVTLEQAIAAGHDVWECVLTQWGNSAPTVPDPVALQFPATAQRNLIPSLAALVVSPASDHDHVEVNYNSRAGLSAQGEFGALWPLDRKHPLLFPVLGPVIYTPSSGTGYGGTYVKFGANAALPFGSAMPAGTFIHPELRLMHYLRALVGGASDRRGPRLYQRFNFVLAVNDVEEAVFVVPTFGRRLVQIQGRPGAATTVSWRVTGFAPGTGSDTQTLVGPQVSAPFESHRLEVAEPGNFIIVYATRTAGAGAFSVSVYVFD